MALTETDRKLLARCLGNDPAGWKDFIDRFSHLFVHVIRHTAEARSIPLTDADIEDLCAEVFLQILARNAAVLRQFAGKSSLATYLAVVVRRIVVKDMARRRKEAGLVQQAAADQSLPSGFVPPLPGQSPLQNVDDRDEILQLLSELPSTDAEVVRQFHLEGKSYREISDQLGIPENSIGPTLHRARERLRDRRVSL